MKISKKVFFGHFIKKPRGWVGEKNENEGGVGWRVWGKEDKKSGPLEAARFGSLFGFAWVLLQGLFEAVHGFVEVVGVEDVGEAYFLFSEAGGAVEAACGGEHDGLVLI